MRSPGRRPDPGRPPHRTGVDDGGLLAGQQARVALSPSKPKTRQGRAGRGWAGLGWEDINKRADRSKNEGVGRRNPTAGCYTAEALGAPDLLIRGVEIKFASLKSRYRDDDLAFRLALFQAAHA